MMKLFYTTLFCLGVLGAVIPLKAQVVNGSDYYAGEARFTAESDDTLSFIKAHLLNESFKESITKAMQSMGMDHGQFWKNFDKEFEENFVTQQKQLEEKYLVGSPEQSSEQRKEFAKALRKRRIVAYSEFGRLGQVITSYSIKKLVRLPQDPSTRFMLVEAKVDRELLNSIYRKFVGNKGGGKIEKIFLTVHFTLKGANWEELGVGSKSDFVDVVADHWKNWLSDNYRSFVEDVELTSESLENQLKEHYKLTSDVLTTLRSGEASSSLFGPSVSKTEFLNSLWLRVNVSLEKLSENLALKQHRFSFAGDVVLEDLRSNRPLASEDLKTTFQTQVFTNAHEFSSALASQAYRSTLETFNNFKNHLRTLPQGLQSKRIMVAGTKNYEDVMTLLELINRQGIGLQVEATSDSYSLGKAGLLVQFSGDEKKFKDVLLSLENKQLGPGPLITFPQKGDPYTIVLQSPKKIKQEKGFSHDQNHNKAQGNGN